MNYKEFGKQNSDVIILLHGGGLSWWNYRKEAEMLQNDFHVILPVLDGHAESDRDFTTIEDNAKEIISFIDETFDGSVLLIGGLSLGGQILLEIMSLRADICEYAIVESALVVPSKMIYSMIKPVFGNCYGLIKHKWFSKLQFKSLKMNQEFFDDYYRDTCKITKQNMIAFLQANSMYSIKDLLSNSNAKVSIFVGGQENSSMKSSAKIISKIIEGSSLRIKEGMYHGEFSINHPGDYVKEIDLLKSKNLTSEVKDFNLRSKEHELKEVQNLDSNYIENNKSKYSKREYSFGENGLGTFQNVFLTAEDISDLQIIMNSQLDNYIERLSAYIKSTGKTYKDHKATILSWFYKDHGRGKEVKTSNIPTWEEYDKGEHL